jgi:hypothetical protein
MHDIDLLFASLQRSAFRSRFRLSPKEADYLREKSLPTVLDHVGQFVTARLAPAKPLNDGRQTPTGNHPVFIAQHATATCCRKCLEKWHRIPKGRPLTRNHIDYIISVIHQWLTKQGI